MWLENSTKEGIKMLKMLSIKKNQNGFIGRLFQATAYEWQAAWSFSDNSEKELISWINNVQEKEGDVKIISNISGLGEYSPNPPTNLRFSR